MDFIKDLFAYFKSNKKYWLIPLFVVLLLLGILVFLSSNAVVAPFVYTLF
jgi:hypothetical protein